MVTNPNPNPNALPDVNKRKKINQPINQQLLTNQQTRRITGVGIAECMYYSKSLQWRVTPSKPCTTKCIGATLHFSQL